MPMSMAELKEADRIDAWSRRQSLAHRKECRDKGCAGKTHIWWITRHPKTRPEVANETAIKFVISQQACEILEMRLVAGDLRWLPGERAAYDQRGKTERETLLQRVSERVEERLPLRVGRTPRRKNKEATPEITRTLDEKFPLPDKPPATGRRYPEPETALDWVDSLTSRRSY